MNNRKQNIPKRIIWLPDILLILAGILLDQFTKHLAVVYLKGSQPVSLIPGVLELRYLEHRGAAFGMMQGAKVFFLIITPVILAAVIYALIKMPSDGKYRVLHILLDYVADMFVSIACVVGAILILFSNKYKDEDFRFLSFKQKQSIPKEEDSPENEKE